MFIGRCPSQLHLHIYIVIFWKSINNIIFFLRFCYFQLRRAITFGLEYISFSGNRPLDGALQRSSINLLFSRRPPHLGSSLFFANSTKAKPGKRFRLEYLLKLILKTRVRFQIMDHEDESFSFLTVSVRISST